MARKRGITRARSLTIGDRAYASRAAMVSKSRVWRICPANQRMSSPTADQARIANGRPHRLIHRAISVTESTSRVGRGGIGKDIDRLPLIDSLPHLSGIVLLRVNKNPWRRTLLLLLLHSS